MKSQIRRTIPLAIAAFFSLTAALFAHKPYFTEDQGGTIDQAITIENVDVSQVFYRAVTPEMPNLWLTFQGSQGKNVFIQLGVPVIDRLTNYRPAVALVGPGLPRENLPPGVPDNLGAIVTTTDNISNPTFFHEPFTGTDSWILTEWNVTLPQTGQYYILAYDPAQQPGKLWVAVGKTEAFGLGDLFSFAEIKRRVRDFHEIDAATASCCMLPFGIVWVFGPSLFNLLGRD